MLWSTSISLRARRPEVPNIEAPLARAESLGGKRLMGPDEVPEAGIVVAHFSDPEGHVVGAVENMEG